MSNHTLLPSTLWQVVKIKRLIWILALCILMSSALGATNETKLYIKDLDVKIGSSTDKNVDNNSYLEDAAPEDKISFRFEIENLWTDEDDLKIQDVFVTVTIQDIDDGDDLEEESDEFDIDPEDTEDVDLDFEVPLRVDEDDYDVIIEVEGEDENNTKHYIYWELTLPVDKEKHDVKIYRKTLTSSSLQCDRTTQLSVGVINIGTEEEEDVILEVTSDILNIKESSTFDLSEDYDDDDNDYQRTYSLNIADDVPAGTYPITIKVTFDDGDEINTDTIDLTLEKCEREEETEPEPEETEQQQQEVTVVEQEQSQTTVSQTEFTAAVPQVTYGTVEESFFQKNKYTLLVVLAYILVIGAIVFAIVKIVTKK